VRVDAAINYYGKPYQTMVAIESLIEQSGDQVDTIYLVKEREQPSDGPMIDELLAGFGERVHVYEPVDFNWTRCVPAADLLASREARWSVRYQYALDNTDKRYLLIAHNDIRFTGDIVGELLRIAVEGDFTGCGLIGQCWNCPASVAGLCDSSRRELLDLTYRKARSLYRQYPGLRPEGADCLDMDRPVPLPECRLNEFACLVNAEHSRSEVLPAGDTMLFGAYTDGIDVGCAWFRSMVLKGYRFQDVHVYQWCERSWANRRGGGHHVLLDSAKYAEDEAVARVYWEQHHARGSTG
jgi:hypothetical protein